MKLKLGAIGILFIFSSELFANAKVVGNGGNIVICKDASDKIISAETLDLFEGRTIYNLNYKEQSTPALLQALQYSDPISEYLGSPVSAKNLSQDLKDLYQNLHFLPRGVGLKRINDIGSFTIPKNCEIVQTINYRSLKNIFVDSDAWMLLSETQKAALLLHEAIYAFYREGFSGVVQEDTSVRARLAVAVLVSGAKVQPVDQLVDLKGNTYLHCRTEAPVTEFFYYKNQNNQFVAQFRFFADHIVLTRTWMDSGNPKVITGNLLSPFEGEVRLQISFEASNKGTIYYLSMWNSMQKLRPGKFACEPFEKI